MRYNFVHLARSKYFEVMYCCIYEMPCDCGGIYIGEPKSHIDIRIREQRHKEQISVKKRNTGTKGS